MRHHRTVLPLAGYTIQQIDFDPATFQPEDLFWLPYHASLTGWGRKRQAEHLAGRIAAAYALREVGEKRLPAIGDQRQPLWPTPWFGSISHCGQRALICRRRRLKPTLFRRKRQRQRQREGQAAVQQRRFFRRADNAALQLRGQLWGKPALDIDAHRPIGDHRQRALGFADFQIVEITASTLALMFAEQRYLLHWIASEEQVITLCVLQQ